MRLTNRQRRRRELDDSIQPLTDIVFLLLIFVLIAGQLVVADAFPVQPPASLEAAPAGPLRAVVLVGPDNALAWNGRPVTLAEVAARLGENPPTRLTVKADAASEATRVIELLDALKGSNIRMVELLAEPGAGAR